MSDKRISELVNLTSLAADDEFVVVDSDANATKRITATNLVKFPAAPTVNGEDVYYQGNILGTVSESGGTPTGAVIERGSNANGEYVKYADGTMICFKQGHNAGNQAILTSFFGGFRSGGLTATYPASFTAIPAATGGGYTNQGLFGFNVVVGAATNNWQFLFTSVGGNSGATRYIDLVAVGRWY